MTNDPAATPSDITAERVREIRRRRRLSVGDLAAVCAAVGYPELTGQAIYNIESGRRVQGRRRRTVSVDELLALALALNASPVDLLVPPEAWDGEGGELLYHITPTRAEQTSTVREWVRGMPLPGDLRARVLDFVTQAPEHELAELLERVAERDRAEQEPDKEE